MPALYVSPASLDNVFVPVQYATLFAAPVPVGVGVTEGEGGGAEA